MLLCKNKVLISSRNYTNTIIFEYAKENNFPSILIEFNIM